MCCFFFPAVESSEAAHAVIPSRTRVHSWLPIPLPMALPQDECVILHGKEACPSRSLLCVRCLCRYSASRRSRTALESHLGLSLQVPFKSSASSTVECTHKPCQTALGRCGACI